MTELQSFVSNKRPPPDTETLGLLPPNATTPTTPMLEIRSANLKRRKIICDENYFRKSQKRLSSGFWKESKLWLNDRLDQ